jgi:NAD(P)-dependent dehydrogenase (short-subunit alcohol dehydrogenase family)
MDELFSVAGDVVVITGGSGNIGSHLAAALLDRGARVAVVDVARPADHLARRCLHQRADVRDRGSLDGALRAIESALGPPASLINCAAIDFPPESAAGAGAFETYPEELWTAALGVNVTGVFLSCQVFGAAIAARGGGTILNISSIYGVVSPDQRIYAYDQEFGRFTKPASYSTSKAAILGLTRYLATYWASAGVRVNALVPGGVYNGQDPRFVERYEHRVPLGRMACVDDYVGPVVFLVSPASRYMTGSVVVVDGGWTAW